MKRIFSLPQYCVRIFIALGICLVGCLSAQAQFTVGDGGMVIKPGTLFSVNGLTLNPTEEITFTRNVLEESTEPLDYAGSPSIGQVYTFGTPILYTGTLRFHYTDAMLAGEPVENLRLIYAAAAGGPFILIPETVVNETGGFVEYEFETPVTLQQFSALARDLIPPTVTSIVVNDTELLAGETSLFTVTFSEAVTGFDNADLTVPNGTLTTVTSMDGGITWTATLTPAADTYEADNIITLNYTGVSDAAGNTGTGTVASNTYTVRTKALTLLVTSMLDTGDDETIAATLSDDEADGTGLSLREALHWVRPGDEITFANPGTITLNGNELTVTRSDIHINGDLDGDGKADIVISANSSSRVLFLNSGASNVELIGLTLTQGVVFYGGAGIYLSPNASVTLRYSNIINNTEVDLGGAGVYGNNAVLTLINSTVSDNTTNTFGGGLRILGANGMLNLINSTLSDNRTTGDGSHGGGIQYAGGRGLNIINSTISGNAVTGSNALGGGLRITSGTSYIYNSTIVGNAASQSGAGVSAEGSSDTFVNTVVAGNTAGAGAIPGAGGSPLASGGSPDDVSGTIETGINNYFGTTATVVTDNNNLNNQGTVSLLLGDLADNGGFVQTHRPQVGSALADAGSVADLPDDTYDLDGDGNTAEPLPVDAAGAARVAGAAVDIGAVEGNSVPVLVGLNGGNTFIEGGNGIVIDDDVTVTDSELDALNSGNGNYSGASFTVMRIGGTVADDVFGFQDGSSITISAGRLVKNGQSIGSFDTSVDGLVTVAFTDADGEIPETSDVNAILQQVTYANTSNNPLLTIELDWTFADGAGATATGMAEVYIGVRNDPPVLTTTGGTPTFTENGPAVGLFSGTSIDVVEYDQMVTDMELTVDNAVNGPEEFLQIDGSDVLLEHGHTVTTTGIGLNVSVSVSDGTATVTIASTAGLSPVDAAAVVDGMTYGHTGDNPGNVSRVITITGVTDDGGTTNGGNDTGEPLVSAIVTMVPINDAPTITGTPNGTVNQNEVYSFVPVAEDLDGDALTFSITNQPAWADFDTATGELSGIPDNDDVGITIGIVISVSDGTLDASLPAFDLEVMNVNDAPTITGTPDGTVNQDEAYSFIPVGNDIDGDVLTYRIVNRPDWADFDTATGELSGVPGNDDVGTTTGIVITVSDGTLDASLPAFDLEVTTKIFTGITFADGSFVYDGTPKTLHITGNLPPGVTATYVNNGRTEPGSQTVTVTIEGVGYTTLVLTADLTITSSERTLNFPVLPKKTYGDADFHANAVSSSGEEITYTSSNTAVAAVTAEGLIRVMGVGEATITATLPENSNYTDRPSVSRALVVGKASQTIAFNAPAEVNRDAGSIGLDVLASSGLPVELTVDDSQVATLEGLALHIHRLGTVRITAIQAGDANHEAAEPVTVTIRVVDPSSDFAVQVHPAVSPNGDGINEFLMIEGIRDYPENRVSIFNRNGTAVWEASGYDNNRVAFRGIGTGQLRLPAGTYFYVAEIRVNGQWKYEKGYFVLRY